MSLKFAFVTDIHFDERIGFDKTVNQAQHWKTVLQDLRGRGITNLIYGGDLGKASSYASFFDDVKEFNMNLIIGNHDNEAQIKKYYRKGNEQFYFYEDVDDYRLIFLNSDTGRIDDQQADWLVKAVKTDRTILLFVHYPLLSVATAMDRQWYLKNRVEIVPILTAVQQPVFLFSGHYHMEDLTVMQNLTQVLTPAVSYQIVKESLDKIQKHDRYFGYRIVEMDGNKMTTEVVTFPNHNSENL